MSHAALVLFVLFLFQLSLMISVLLVIAKQMLDIQRLDKSLNELNKRVNGLLRKPKANP